MTLNITVVTNRGIYQSADYRLRDWRTGRLTDFETQKILVTTHTFKWTATVCFAGVGRTSRVNVGTWLAERTAAIQPNDPFERLLDVLLTADEWLSEISPPNDSRHSFSVGAFVGSKPNFALISNFESLSRPPLAVARPQLSVHRLKLVIPKTFVSGAILSREERRRLTALAAKHPDPQRMHAALAQVNRSVSGRTTLVSEACFTTHLELTGGGTGVVHNLGNRPFIPEFVMPSSTREGFTRVLDQQFGPGRARFRQMTFMRAEASDEYHQLQLREKPNDPNTHSNYGAFLKDKKGDAVGAEREYQRALELDERHVNALGNLANLMREKGDLDHAERLYRKALETSPQNENVTYNFAQFLLRERHDRAAALILLRSGIGANPNSGRLMLLHGDLSMLEGRHLEALDTFLRARETTAEQAQVECGYACALHQSGAPTGECLAAYRVAIALNPNNAALRLNLAQLLFVKDEESEANKQLQNAMRMGLDDSELLEGLFYQLAHTSVEPSGIFRTMNECLSRGGRVRWNLTPNIEKVKKQDPRKALLLESVSRILIGEEDPTGVTQVLAQWRRPSEA